jgi:hypothetical protein
MRCPRCGSDRVRRSSRRGLIEGLVLRAFRRAPFRCFACGKRFIDEDTEQRYRRVGSHRSLAAYIGLGRRQRFKLLLLFIGAIVVVAAFGFLSWFSYQLATRPTPKRRKY